MRPIELPPELRATGDELVDLGAVGSTMEEARRRFAPGLAHRVWIVAREQTSGRGRQGRGWASPPGNLHMTLLLPTATPPRDQPKLGFAAGVALARAARSLLPEPVCVALKWPNDLLVAGAKASGLLLEGLGGGAAVGVGIGVNVVAHPADTPYRATHLSVEAPGLDRGRVFACLSRALVEEVDVFAEGRGFALTRQRWLGFAAHRGRQIIVRLDGREIEGVFVDIDADGRLLLDAADGRIPIAAGDVFPLDK